MNTGFIIAISLIVGLSLLFIFLKLISSLTRRKLHNLVANKFEQGEILGASTRANFFGIKSKGGAQIRGNGVLILTKNGLHYIRAAPQKEYKIPISAIRNVSMPRAFNGKSVFVPLLCVTYDAEYGEDSIAWAIKDAKKWKDAIQKMII
jgi:hypothetical protein